MKEFNLRLKIAREASQIEKSDLVKELKTSYSNYQKLESGLTKNPGIQTISEFCEITKANFNYLFGYSKVKFRGTYADSVIYYMAQLPAERQREIVILIRNILNSFSERLIEDGQTPIELVY